jgi:hypothetical protein
VNSVPGCLSDLTNSVETSDAPSGNTDETIPPIWFGQAFLKLKLPPFRTETKCSASLLYKLSPFQIFFNLLSQLISKAQHLPSVSAEHPECPIALGVKSTYIVDNDLSEIRQPCLDIVLVFLYSLGNVLDGQVFAQASVESCAVQSKWIWSR